MLLYPVVLGLLVGNTINAGVDMLAIAAGLTLITGKLWATELTGSA
jgi:hypothetical protein